MQMVITSVDSEISDRKQGKISRRMITVQIGDASSKDRRDYECDPH